MKTEKINGVTVPHNLSTEELEKMLTTDNMGEFVVACEALSHKEDEKAFAVLKGYIKNKDKYKRLCVLKTIFNHPSSSLVLDFLEESIQSDAILFAQNGLNIVYEQNLSVDEKIILSAVFRHLHNLYMTDLYVLNSIPVNEENYTKLVKLFKKSEKCGQKEVLSEILCKKYLPDKSGELYELFSNDRFFKIRKKADKLGNNR